MRKIRSINTASALIGLCGGAVALAVALLLDADTWNSIRIAAAVAIVVALISRIIINNFIAHNIKPLYRMVLSKDVKAEDVESSILNGKKSVSSMQDELTHWADNNNRELTRLKDSERYRREFLGDISHEMKTPLFALQSYLFTLQDGAMEDGVLRRKYLERSEKSIDRLVNIVTDLEEISKLESGALVLRRDRFDLAELTREIVEDASIEAEKESITITVAGDASHPVYVVADRKYIGQVIANLVINSIKYGVVGGKSEIHFADMFDKVVVEVSDNGIGVAPQDLPRLFERFFRIDKSRSRDMGGSGLGLSIVKHIIEAHGEKISVRSQQNIGSTFSFTLSKS